VAAVKASGNAKTRDQIAIHGNAALFVDCTSFRDDHWRQIIGEKPAVGHEPVVVFRMRPDGRTEGYVRGNLLPDVGSVLHSPPSDGQFYPFYCAFCRRYAATRRRHATPPGNNLIANSEVQVPRSAR